MATSASPRNVLIVCSHFWPSVGGLEVSMGQLAEELLGAGHQVSVMTLAHPGRGADAHNGVRILSVAMPEFSAAIRAAVASGDYGACILVQDPLGNIIWSVEGLVPPPGTRLLLQPIINEDGYGRWKDNADFRRRLAAILSGADAALAMTRSGPDTRFMREAGIDYTYLPNAVSRRPAAGDFRARFGIAPERFMVLHVANLYWVKNHIGLIDALPDLPPSWQLVMIGNPSGAQECVEAVLGKLATRPEILYIPGLPPEWIAAAMAACDVAVLASHGEGSPITLLEAMSHGKPWLATPQCGAANDHLGGLIRNLPDFRATLAALAAQPELRAELGRISHAHWQQCYAWPQVLQGWRELIDGGRLQRSFAPTPALVEQMRAAQELLNQTLPTMQTTSAPLVTVIVTTYNHERYLQRALDSIEAQVMDRPMEIVIHDDCSTDGTAEICRQFAARSRHTVKLILQPLNKMSRGLGILKDIFEQCTGEFITFCEGDDFWLHPGKLAYQCQSLGQLPHVDMCFHKAARVEWQTEALTGMLCDYGEEPKLFPVHAVIEGDGGFIPTASMVFRRSVLPMLPAWFYNCVPVTDYFLQVFSALRGGALYLPVCASAYREGDPSSWTQRTFASLQTVYAFDRTFIGNLFHLRADLPEHCHASLDKLQMSRFLLYCQRCYTYNTLDAITPLLELLKAGRPQRQPDA